MRRIVYSLLVAALIVCLAACGVSGIKYTITQTQWEDSLGSEEYHQTVYNNIVIEIFGNAVGAMKIAVDGDSIYLQAAGYETIGTSIDGVYYTFLRTEAEGKWYRYEGKTADIDEYRNTYIRDLVHNALEGLKDKFSLAVYDENEKTYTVVTQIEGGTLTSTLSFQNGKLVALKSVSTANEQTETLCIYEIGTTVIATPTEFEIAS